MRKLYFISCCIFLTAVCTTVIQSCKKNDDSSVEVQPQGKLLDNAKAWFKAQSLLPTSPDSNDIQLSSYKPDWNKFKVIKNAGGTDVIGIPLSTDDGTYMEINYFNLNERNFGIIKKYNWANKEMMIYSGTGRLQQRASYYPAIQKIVVLERANNANSMKLAFEDMYYLPEVTVGGGSYTPPPPPPTYTFPPAPVYTPPGPDPTYYQYQGGGSGNSTGSTNTTPSYANDISNQVSNLALKGLVDALRFSNISGKIGEILSKLTSDRKVKLTFVDALHTSKGGPAETSGRAFDPTTGNYIATITLSTDILLATTKEAATAAIIHEVVHAYFGYDLSILPQWAEHETMARDYVSPMASFLQGVYGMSNKDAIALAWTGLEDAPSYIGSDNFSYTTPTANGLTSSTMTKDVMTDIYRNYVIKTSGTPVTQ